MHISFQNIVSLSKTMNYCVA